MKEEELPADFVARCRKVKAKRPRTVIEHILEHGFITTEELKNLYGYNHPPRAARDVREQGIPLETFRVVSSDGRSIGAYRFGDPSQARFTRLRGRTLLSRKLKEQLLEQHGPRCAIYLEFFDERDLQIDHRIPYEVSGDSLEELQDLDKFMLLCGSANRAKSWSCEHCVNWRELRNATICSRCYWAYPEGYDHIAMRPIRRVDIMWTGNEVNIYEQLKQKTHDLQKELPEYIKEIIKVHLKE